MKNLTLIFSLVIICGLLQGQESTIIKNSARFGLNGTFFGAGDVWGIGIYGEYTYSLNEYFGITPRIISAYAHHVDDGYFHHLSSFGISLSVRITPLPNTFRRLKLDIGGLYHKFIDTWGELGQETEYDSYVSPNTTYYKSELFGLIGSLSYNVIDTKRTEMGFRYDMLTSIEDAYFACDSWQIGVYIGLKF